MNKPLSTTCSSPASYPSFLCLDHTTFVRTSPTAGGSYNDYSKTNTALKPRGIWSESRALVVRPSHRTYCNYTW